MKLRIQALYEQGGDAAWFQMMLNSEDLSELLTRAENTQQMYEQDRKNLDKYVNTINEVNNLKTQYESDKAELEEMKASYEQQSYDLQCQIDQKKSESADYENEIAYAQQQATEYANLLAEQTAEIQRLEAERITIFIIFYTIICFRLIIRIISILNLISVFIILYIFFLF